ncbi:hypothetical protein [Marinitenerispora sediminis]|uniref:Uncharacterized protein n=2 Tax=Marinitenerispora sediminis TaxID=1931232 RepID=A0A368SXS0_9ACTN|nr:hypothetical protein [Marinitenerispora sediminis]RCV47301.1 hypothetical protein DEF28_26600 [Marinitenerispora sediminis]RCV47539.1 hypothetical protein DEF24_27040 [Marinitenerispora sediminis]RCV48132.1 hypothetical protein DEF23_25540 [Marinitenerispora sediminis]
MKTNLRRITLTGLVATAVALGTPAMAGAQDIFGGRHFWGFPGFGPSSSFQQQATQAGPFGAGTFGTRSHAQGGF